jgi:hypothetical protein
MLDNSTKRLAHAEPGGWVVWLGHVGLALRDAAGRRLGKRFSMSTSADRLLRSIRSVGHENERQPTPACPHRG